MLQMQNFKQPPSTLSATPREPPLSVHRVAREAGRLGVLESTSVSVTVKRGAAGVAVGSDEPPCPAQAGLFVEFENLSLETAEDLLTPGKPRFHRLPRRDSLNRSYLKSAAR